MIYVSTGLIKNQSFDEIVSRFHKNGINNIELSGGLHDPKIFEKLSNYKNTKINFMLHNYFPPPKTPFTLNLATLNDDLYKNCKDHIINSIKISSKLGIKYYSFHAGYLIDPDPKELGKKIKKKKKNDETKATEKFLERLVFFSEFSKNEGVELLIENNVINKENFDTFDGNPLLMTSIDQTENLVKNFPENVNILLDLAHLKVSANTLKFSASNYIKKFDNKIKAYHLSDNEGLYDTNDLITKDSWFWDYISRNKDYYTLELNTFDINKIKKQIQILNNFLE
tara:strand:+ start:8754 stop:9602 length:849 start_codon:yes stop_codon:yes gene_type:complete